MQSNQTARHYLLTGATGVVGSAVLQRLAKRSERTTLLIRGSDNAEVETRLKSLLDFCSVSSEAVRKIDALPCDLYRQRLGLEKSDYERVAATCTHIIHCAGNVHMNLPLEEARRQTMAMTEGILELLTVSSNVKKMEFVSTVGIGGNLPGEIPESWIFQPRTFRNSYEAAKAEAEEEVRKKIKAGLPITVHRPSMVVGDSNTGRNISFQVFYYLCEFLSGSRTMGFIPRLNGTQLDTVPADYVARIIDWSSRKDPQDFDPPILHICSGPQGAINLDWFVKTIRTIFKANGRRLPPIIKVPVPMLRMLIIMVRPLMSSKNRRAVAALPFFFAYLKDKQFFANTRTLKLAQSDGITLPKTGDYLKPVLTYYLEETKRRHDRKKTGGI